MRPIRRPLFVAFVLSSILGSASRADEPAAPTYQVALRNRWKSGDVATLAANEKREKSIVRFVGGKASENAADSFKEYRVVDHEVVATCVDAGPDGVPTKMVLWFASFVHGTKGEAGLENDATLEKVFVEVNGIGAARTVTILSPDAKVSPRVLRWLDAEYGRGAKLDALCGALESKEPVCEGTTWKVAGDVIASAVGSDDAPIDADKTSADVTLASVEGGKGVYRLVVRLAPKGRLVGKAILPWKTGGVGKLEIRMTRALSSDGFDTTGEFDEEFEGATADTDGETRVSIKTVGEWVWSKGGTTPGVPKPGASKPDGPAPEGPTPPDGPPAPDAPKSPDGTKPPR